MCLCKRSKKQFAAVTYIVTLILPKHSKLMYVLRNSGFLFTCNDIQG